VVAGPRRSINLTRENRPPSSLRHERPVERNDVFQAALPRQEIAQRRLARVIIVSDCDFQPIEQHLIISDSVQMQRVLDIVEALLRHGARQRLQEALPLQRAP